MTTLSELLEKQDTEGAPDVGAMARELGLSHDELVGSLIAAALQLQNDNWTDLYRHVLGLVGWGAAIGYYYGLKQGDALLAPEVPQGGLPC